MTRFMVEGKFDKFKEAFKKQWDKIGSEELDSMLDIKANEEDVINKLAQSYEKSKEEMKKDFHEWLDRISDEKDDDVDEIMDDIKNIEEQIRPQNKVDEIMKKIEDIEENVPKK